jgi:hypothetical protein
MSSKTYQEESILERTGPFSLDMERKRFLLQDGHVIVLIDKLGQYDICSSFFHTNYRTN